jgi:hypothetical protein
VKTTIESAPAKKFEATQDTTQIKNFIDGQFVEPVGGRYLDNIEPATGRHIRRSQTATVAMSILLLKRRKKPSRIGRENPRKSDRAFSCVSPI